MTKKQKSAKTPAPDPQRALDELSEAIDEMEAGIKDRARDTLCSMSPQLKIGLAVGALAVGAAAVLFALRQSGEDCGHDAEDTGTKKISPKLRDAVAEAAGKAVKAGFAALADRIQAADTKES
ncbi:MAG: hypothetical protein R6V19_06010 [Armatimonadota bacterium]